MKLQKIFPSGIFNDFDQLQLHLWSGRAPNSTETQKEVKRAKSGSEVTPRVPPPSELRWPKSDSKLGSGVTFEAIEGHFGIGLPESLLSHFWATLIL